ncbi:ArnT family glycosyltransferase [Asticcacaulis sp. 201]|uniref:ArnT family glycosyltransferase n=1 Tax=Asticcacaulis sp. 201 TaxID=3028787 RepID=UPI0029164EC2|nr:glycosyltransferase family 39 protein [Asticcacaulis sp. 201]MDV6332215.1 glycosyltransferase family 39 protein [Asticcacaulis sp. 201]
MVEFYDLNADRPALAPQKPFLGDDKHLIRALFIVGALLVVWKFYIALISHVIWEEGHFVLSGEYLDLGYPDIPAGFPWLARLITALFGWHLMPLRIVSLLIATAIPFAVYFMAKPLVSHRNALWAAMIALLLPPLSLNGTVFYPEGSLQLLMALMLGCLIRGIQRDEMKWWILTGVCAALGLLVHFRFMGPGLGVIAFMLISREGRKLWTRPGVWVTAGIAFLGLVPSLIYNAVNEWPAIQFHVLNRPKLQPNFGRILGYVETQFALATPVFFIAMVVAAKNLLTRDRDKPESLLAYQAVVIFLFYGLQTIVNKKIMPHWPFMAFVPLLPYVPELLENFIAKAVTGRGLWMRQALIATGPLLALTVGIAGTAYQWAFVHSAELPYRVREHNILKNENWSLLEPDLAAADARAKARFGPDIVWAANSHMSAVHIEFPAVPGVRGRRLFTLDDPNDELTRFVVARHHWGLDLPTLVETHKGKGVMMAVLEPSYLYHEPDQVAMYTALCRNFEAVEPFRVVSLPPYKMAVDFYTARVRQTPLTDISKAPCPFFPQVYIAHPERGEFLDTDNSSNFFGVAADPKGVTAVDILIDGKVVTRARYGLDPKEFRVPDLLKYDSNWPRLQYDFQFPKGSLVPGEHKLSVRATRSDGTTLDGEPRTLYVR